MKVGPDGGVSSASLRARTISVCSQKPMHCAGEPKVGESARGKMAHKRNIVDNFKAKSIHSAAALRSERGRRSLNLWTMLNVTLHRL